MQISRSPSFLLRSPVLFAALALAIGLPLRAQPAAKPAATAPHAAAAAPRHRAIILTDIGADPDDTMSLVRLLTYANEIDIRGLVATTSTFQKNRTEPESIRAVLDAYKVAEPHLMQHEAGYPTFDELRARVAQGPAVFGMEGVGEGKDSTGSELIVRELERNDPRPLWIPVWGGTNVLAQALWKIQHTLKPEQAAALYAKLRVYTISDQDDTGSWIRKNFPTIFYICSPGSFMKATWFGMHMAMPGSNTEVVGKEWLARNIQQGHGPLGAVYPDVAYGMEGDTPSFLNLIPNGLNEPEHPNWGGWGGRYELYTPEFTEKDWKPMGQNTVRPEPETRPLWTNAEDTVTIRTSTNPFDPNATPPKSYTSAQATIWRWRVAYQNDFAARICWATHAYKECNHPPVPVLAGPAEFTVAGGQEFFLDATGSHDPDGDSLSYNWFQYREAGSKDVVANTGVFAQNLRRLPVTAPEVKSPATVHFILEVTDKGTPPLTRYRRVIVHIQPKP